MNINIDTIVIILYLVGILYIGIKAGRNIKNIEGYSVAGRGFGPWVIFATLSASFIGGGFSLGNAEKVFIFGIANIVALWGFSLKEILVAKFIAPKIKQFPKAISVGDIMFKNYGNFGKITTGIFGFLLCMGILAAQVSAIGYVFNLFLGISQTLGALIGCAIVIVYSTLGGMNAVIKTDIIQFIVLGLGLPLALIFGIHHVGGFDALISNAPAGHFSIPAEGKTIVSFISLFLVFMLGETLVPPYVQRLCIGKNAKDVEKGTMMAGLFSIPFFAITGLFGLVALSMNPDLDPNLSIPFVVNECMPVFLKGIVIAGIISIAMSSADSFLNSASVAIVHDVIKPIKKRALSAKKELFAAKVTTAVCGAGAVFLALTFKSVLGLLLLAYDFWAPIILVPLFLTIIGKKFSKESFIAGAIIGLTVTILWNQVLKQPLGINALPFGVLSNMVAMIICEKTLKMKK
jgi:solute:Na+ symporter, SSS family